MRRWLLLVLLLLSLSAYAGGTYRIGNQVLTVGDSAARAAELLGQPVYREPIEDAYGAYRGERWQFAYNSTTVVVVIYQGRVASIDELRN
ncbi:MAG: DUF2845 domain-containing protein [Dyella sp.]